LGVNKAAEDKVESGEHTVGRKGSFYLTFIALSIWEDFGMQGKKRKRGPGHHPGVGGGGRKKN